MTISLLSSCDLEEVSRLTIRVFDQQVAPLYSMEGNAEFYRYVDPGFLAEKLSDGMRIFGAREGDSLIGILAMKDFSHISLFFVDKPHQKKGIGRLLFDRAAAESADSGVKSLSVNASPNAVGIYTALGFLPEGKCRTVNGITSQPMSRELKDYLEARKGNNVTDESLLPGIRGMMVCGFESDEILRMTTYLEGLLNNPVRTVSLSAESLDKPLADVLNEETSAEPVPADKLPRVVLLSGISFADVRNVVEQWTGSGLPRPIFATTTARNLYFPVRELLKHLLEERRRQTGKDD